jgi:hypothetical protein
VVIRRAPGYYAAPAVFLLLLVLLLGLVVRTEGEPRLDESGAFRVRENRCWTYRPSERRFSRLMNAARERAGRNRLSLDPEASKVARKHSREMVDRNLLYHTPSSSLIRRVTRWQILGENVGVGGSVGSLHEAFMGSRPHRANILYAKFRHVGVGVRKSHDGRMWVTVVFENRLDPGTRLRMPRC